MNSTQHVRRPIVEVCVGTLSDAIVAAAAGANRLELCSATEIGGLTPSAGLIERVIESIALPIVVMIRPRPGGFCYSREEFATAVRDAEIAIEGGATGIVFGFLTADGRIDISRCRELVRIAGQRQTVFHRAFDFVPDACEAADQLAELSVTRLLTSGQKATAIAGADLIRTILTRSFGSLEVMAGGGISAENVEELVRRTGCSQIHAGASRPANDGSQQLNPSVNLYTRNVNILDGGCFRAVDGSFVAKLVSRLSSPENP